MEKHIPPQVEGKSLDCHKDVSFSSIEEATAFYQTAKRRLFDVNRWNEITEAPSATFTITNSSGEKLDRDVQQHDYIRIDIPGPGLPSAKGYDWVQVEDIAETADNDSTNIVLTLRPCPDPTQDSTDTAHFFTHLATSSFVLTRTGCAISIHYAGRNEVINTENTAVLDNLRNFMVGLGAKMGASFPQWKALVEGLGNTDYDK